MQRKRDSDNGQTAEDLPLSIQAKWSHWSFVLAEAAWLSKDIRQERMWKKKMAFLFAYEIATSSVKLRPVDAAEVVRVKGEGDWEGTGGGHAARRPSRHRCDHGTCLTHRPCHTSRCRTMPGASLRQTLCFLFMRAVAGASNTAGRQSLSPHLVDRQCNKPTRARLFVCPK